MRQSYQCPRCQRLFLRRWFFKGRCPDCGVGLVDWTPPQVAGAYAERDSLPGLSLPEGVHVWRVWPTIPTVTPGGETLNRIECYVGLPSGEVFLLERREQVARAAPRIASGRAALDYARLLYSAHLGRLFLEQPRYVELSAAFFSDWGEYALDGIDESRIKPSVSRQPGDACFSIKRYAITFESLPTEFEVPTPLGAVLRLEESIFPDGRYLCEAAELPPPERSHYRGPEASRPFERATVRRKQPMVRKGRPLQVAGADRAAGLRRGRW